jgi:hypothetical protein
MKVKHTMVALMSFLVISSIGAIAANDSSMPKVSVAVYKIRTHNCDPALGMVIEELLMSRLFTTSLFTLMDKSQMERIAEKSGVQDFDIIDNVKMAQLGMKLKVDKIVVGSLLKLGLYRLEIRSIDVYTGMVDVSTSITVDSEKEIEKKVNDACGTIERYYQGYSRISGKFDLGISGAILYPGARLGKYYNTGSGAFLSGNFNRFALDAWTLTIGAGFYYSAGRKSSVQSVYMFPFEATYGPVFRINDSLTVCPSGGFGYVISRVLRDPNNPDYLGKYHYRTETLMNLSILARTECSFFIYDRYCAFLSPGIVFLPEKNETTFYIDIRLGMKILF